MTGPTKPERAPTPPRPKEPTKAAETKAPTAEKQAETLRAQGVQPGAASAAGHAAAGSPTPEEDFHTPGPGAEEVQDTMLAPGKPIGKQAEAAIITPTGSVEPGTVPSPSGPVPAAAIADDRLREEAVKRAAEGIDDARRVVKNSRRRFTEEDLRLMSPAEVRAVASDRGYPEYLGGRAGVVRHFLKAQEEDDTLDDTGGQTPSERRRSAPAPRPARAATPVTETAAPGVPVATTPTSPARTPAPRTPAATTPPRPAPPARAETTSKTGEETEKE
jgi:hypothetical protein